MRNPNRRHKEKHATKARYHAGELGGYPVVIFSQNYSKKQSFSDRLFRVNIERYDKVIYRRVRSRWY